MGVTPQRVTDTVTVTHLLMGPVVAEVWRALRCHEWPQGCGYVSGIATPASEPATDALVMLEGDGPEALTQPLS